MKEQVEIDAERLRISERQYRRLFETARDGILILNAMTGQIEDVNPYLIGLLGYSREEFLGKKLWEVGPFRDVEACRAAFEELYAKEYIRYDDLPLETKHGELISVEFVSNVYALNGGKVIQCNIRDNSERKKQLDELRRAREDADSANKAKDRFLGMLGHELRTPLNPAMMVIHAWKTEKRLPPELLPDVEIIRQSIEIQTDLIDDLLDVAAISQGKMRLRLKSHEVHELLRYALEVVQAEINENKLQVVMRLDARHSVVSTDSTRLLQVFWNLTRNAVKFSPVGAAITISTQNEGSKIQIVIADAGIGIPKEWIARIFEPFEQGKRGERHAFGGVGLGLTIAKNLIELMGGSITAESEGSGKGSSFTVMLETSQE